MNRSIFAFSLAVAAGPLAVLACGESAPPPSDPAKITVTPSASSAPSADVSVAPSASPSPSMTTPPPPPPTVEDVAASDDPKPLPVAKISKPSMGLSVGDAAKAKDYVVQFSVDKWDFKEGRHAHLILDNNPYKKITDPKTPVKLGELLPAGQELAEGQHILALFPSRPTHETVKGKGAGAYVVFWVGKPQKIAPIDPKKPIVIYSRPKGANAGDMGKDLLVDFYLFNTALDKGDKVTFSIAGGTLTSPVAGDFMKWQPKLVHHLAKGDYTLTLTYADKDGKAMEQTYPATGKFSVDADAPNDPNMGMGMNAAPAASSAAPSK